MSLQAKKPRPKRCRVETCGVMFEPDRMGQAVCSPACAIIDAPKNQDKAQKAMQQAERKSLRDAKERVKTKVQYMREAQTVINRYVRLRDAKLGCISCDKPASWHGQWHCSHFRSVGAAPHLRFNLWNMNRACSVCNNHLSGNIGAYKPALIEKIGSAKVDWLESNHARAGHDIEYLKRLKRIFSKKCRILEGRLSCSVA